LCRNLTMLPRSSYLCATALAVAAATAAATQCTAPGGACTEAETKQMIQEAVKAALLSVETVSASSVQEQRRLLGSPHTGTWPPTGGVAAQIAATNIAMDTMWLLICAVLVFFMQCGFAMVEAGAVRHGSVKSILFKNLLDPCFAALTFWAFGYGFAYGGSDDPNVFIGDKFFFLSNFESVDSYANFLFQWAFAATAATIVSGAVAERCKIEAFFMYNILLTGFVYPVVVHWVWSAAPLLSAHSARSLRNLTYRLCPSSFFSSYIGFRCSWISQMCSCSPSAISAASKLGAFTTALSWMSR